MKTLTHKFVELMPEHLEEGVLYVSIPYALVSHKCCCGCGNEVVTPISPTDWLFIFDGDSVSLYPSIGNWGFPCKSHYWIQDGKVEWAEQWTDSKIKSAQRRDRVKKQQFYREAKPAKAPSSGNENKKPGKQGLWSRIRRGKP